MLYQTWNLRCIPFFKEEITEEDQDTTIYPSIKEFQQADVYTPEVRALLVNYINNCKGIVATTYKRYNPYQEKFQMGLDYSTDGEIIFNDFLRDYIQYDDFAIPALWLDLIKKKDFRVESFTLDFDRITTGNIDVFKTIQETFEEIPTIKKVMIAED
jgi:hypothetical protein